MRSLPRIIKTARLDLSDEVFRIPDGPEGPPLSPEGEESSPETDTAPRQEEPLSPEELERQREEARLKRERMMEEQSRQKAEELAQRILQSARTERERMLEQTQAEAARLREEARQAAYQAAYAEKEGELRGKLSELDRLMERLQQDQQDFLRQYREGLSGLALEIAQKLIDESIAAHQELMKPLVQKAVSAVKNAEWISVQVSDRLPGLAEELKKELAGRNGLPPVDVIAGDGPAGSCVVHTPEGILDASVSTQLENLRSLFEGTGF